MAYVDLVCVLALLQLVYFASLVGKARGRYGVKAPAMSGNELFERQYRVQMNTIELIVLLIPAMYIAARYWSAPLVAATAAVYLVGRFVYARSYVADPATRSVGFGLSMLPILALLLADLAGIVFR